MERLSTWIAEPKEVVVRVFDVELDRQQSGAEEITNSISHGIGLIAALVGAPILIVAIYLIVIGLLGLIGGSNFHMR